MKYSEVYDALVQLRKCKTVSPDAIAVLIENGFVDVVSPKERAGLEEAILKNTQTHKEFAVLRPKYESTVAVLNDKISQAQEVSSKLDSFWYKLFAGKDKLDGLRNDLSGLEQVIKIVETNASAQLAKLNQIEDEFRKDYCLEVERQGKKTNVDIPKSLMTMHLSEMSGYKNGFVLLNANGGSAISGLENMGLTKADVSFSAKTYVIVGDYPFVDKSVITDSCAALLPYILDSVRKNMEYFAKQSPKIQNEQYGRIAYFIADFKMPAAKDCLLAALDDQTRLVWSILSRKKVDEQFTPTGKHHEISKSGDKKRVVQDGYGHITYESSCVFRSIIAMGAYMALKGILSEEEYAKLPPPKEERRTVREDVPIYHRQQD